MTTYVKTCQTFKLPDENEQFEDWKKAYDTRKLEYHMAVSDSSVTIITERITVNYNDS